LADSFAQHRPDILLLELTADVTFSLLTELRNAITGCKVVLWVTEISTELAFQAMGLGVRGILRKKLPPELQIRCLEKVADGELWFEKALTDSFLTAKRVVLTPREGQLVNLLSQGYKNKEIATTLTISEGTVKVYLSRLFQKVGVKDRFELALFGLKNMAPGQNLGNEPAEGNAVTSLRSLVMDRPPARPNTAAPFVFRRPQPVRQLN